MLKAAPEVKKQVGHTEKLSPPLGEGAAESFYITARPAVARPTAAFRPHPQVQPVRQPAA